MYIFLSMNKAILIFLCLFAFIFSQDEDNCKKVNEDKIGRLPKLFECYDAGNCCLAAFKSGGKYYTYCGKSKDDLKDQLEDYHIVEIFCKKEE